MNILYLAHRIPYPPNKGEKIRAFHQLRHLSKHHTVHLVCLVDDPTDLEHISILKQYCTSVVAVSRHKTSALRLATHMLLTHKPLSVTAFYRKALAREVAHKLLTETFDVIFVSSAAMAQYVLEVSTVPRVIDFIDVDSEKWRQYALHPPLPLAWLYALEARRLAVYEAHIAHVFTHAVLISHEEKRLFQRCICDRPVTVISNGVDLHYFVPKHNAAVSPRQPVLVFTGAMDYF